MSGAPPGAAETVGPSRCNEKPWDLWVGEIGHASLSGDERAFLVPPDGKAPPTARRPLDAKALRYRRAGINRLKRATMSLHGLFPQTDNLNAVVCHMCGMAVKCSAAHRHLVQYHAAGAEPILPPPPPAPTVKLKSAHGRSKHRKEPPAPPPPAEPEPPPPPPPPLYFPEPEPAPSALPPDLKLCIEGPDLPVVSIQDAAELPLGDNLTDDIFAIMNSEGIQSAEDVSDADTVAWKSLMQDFNSIQEMTFPPSIAPELAGHDLYAASFAVPADVAVQPPLAPTLPPAPETPPPVAAKTLPRPKSSKSKVKTYNLREYDPNKHCGVLTDGRKPCTRSLTCKAHALSLRRTVEGRTKPFDVLLAEHRAAREGFSTPAFVDEVYTVPPATLPDVSESVVPAERTPPAAERLAPPDRPPTPEPSEVCWYATAPRPLALCSFGASHAGGAALLGRRFASVRADFKSALSRSQGKAGYYEAAGGPAAGKAGAGRPELRRLVVTCPSFLGRAEYDAYGRANGHAPGGKRPADEDAESKRSKLRGGVKVSKHVRQGDLLELSFMYDPLVAEDKC